MYNLVPENRVLWCLKSTQIEHRISTISSQIFAIFDDFSKWSSRKTLKPEFQVPILPITKLNVNQIYPRNFNLFLFLFSRFLFFFSTFIIFTTKLFFPFFPHWSLGKPRSICFLFFPVYGLAFCQKSNEFHRLQWSQFLLQKSSFSQSGIYGL